MDNIKLCNNEFHKNYLTR